MNLYHKLEGVNEPIRHTGAQLKAVVSMVKRPYTTKHQEGPSI